MVGVLVVVGCGAGQGVGNGQGVGDVDAALRQRDVMQAPVVAQGGEGLVVEVRDVASVGRTVRFRGRATNRYEQTVDGVRYRLRLFSTDGDRVLRSEYDEADGEIAPGESEPFEIELQSMYFATVPRFVIDAVPVRLGDSDYPAPPDWR